MLVMDESMGRCPRTPLEQATFCLPLMLLSLPWLTREALSGATPGLGLNRVQGRVASPRGLLPTEVVFGWKV